MGAKVLRQRGFRRTQGRQPVHILCMLQVWEALSMQKNKRLQTPLNLETQTLLLSAGWGQMSRPHSIVFCSQSMSMQGSLCPHTAS